MRSLSLLRPVSDFSVALAGFDPARVARFDARRRTVLLRNPGIVRNRLKVESTVSNARAFLEAQEEFGSFDGYVWRFVDGKPLQNRRSSLRRIPATTPESDALSADLRKRGFRFVGSTIMYAFMQAVGMVNDHVKSCFKGKGQRAKVKGKSKVRKNQRSSKTDGQRQSAPHL